MKGFVVKFKEALRDFQEHGKRTQNNFLEYITSFEDKLGKTNEHPKHLSEFDMMIIYKSSVIIENVLSYQHFQGRQLIAKVEVKGFRVLYFN